MTYHTEQKNRYRSFPFPLLDMTAMPSQIVCLSHIILSISKEITNSLVQFC